MSHQRRGVLRYRANGVLSNPTKLGCRSSLSLILCAAVVAMTVSVSSATTVHSKTRTHTKSPHAALINVVLAQATYASDYIGYIMAVQQGYYARQGFNVTVAKLSGANAVPALIAGSIQFAAAGGSAIPAAMKGLPVKVLSVAVSSAVYVIIAKDSIANLKGLEGQELGVQSKGDTTQIADNIFLPKNGVNPATVTEVGLGSTSAELAALEGGAVPAITGDVQQLGQLQSAGLLGKFHVIGTEEGKVPLPITGLAVSDSYLATHQRLVEKFLYATAQGMKYGLSHEKASINLLASLDNETPTDASYDFRYSGTWPVSGSVSNAVATQAIAAYSAAFGIPVVPEKNVFDFSLAKQEYKRVFGKQTGNIVYNHPPLICNCSKGIGK